MCIRDRIAAAPLLAVEAAREDDPIDRAAVEAALRALEDLHVVGIECAGGPEFELLVAHALQVDVLGHALEPHHIGVDLGSVDRDRTHDADLAAQQDQVREQHQIETAAQAGIDGHRTPIGVVGDAVPIHVDNAASALLVDLHRVGSDRAAVQGADMIGIDAVLELVFPIAVVSALLIAAEHLDLSGR